MLNKILEEQKPNASMILGCYNNAMPSNIKFAIRASQIEYLHATIENATKMEDIILEIGVDLDIILRKIQIQMDNLSISNQEASTSKRNEDQTMCHTENQGVGGRIFKGQSLM
jgi:hypothetical protein